MKVIKTKTTITLETLNEKKFDMICNRFGMPAVKNISIDLSKCSDEEIAFLIRNCDVGLTRDCELNIRLED